MKRLYTLLLCVLVFNCSAIGNLDSLKSQYATFRKTEDKLVTCFLICDKHYSYSIDSFKKYSFIASTLSEKTNNPLYKAEADYHLAQYHALTYNIAQAQKLLLQALRVSPPDAIFFKNKCQLLLATTLMKENRQKEAMQTYYGLLSASLKHQDTFTYLRSLNGIGWANMELARYHIALIWLDKCINLPVSKDYEIDKLPAFTNAAACRGNLNQIDSAAYYVQKGLRIARKNQHLSYTANALNVLSNVYIYQNDYHKAIACLQEATHIRNRIGDPYFIVSDMAQLALLYSQINQKDSAIAMLQHAITIAKDKRLESKMVFLYNSLSTIYADKEDYKNAYSTIKHLMVYKNNQYQQATRKELADLHIKYETSLKENTIQKQQFELIKKNYIIVGSASLIILGLILAVFIYRNIQHRNAIDIQRKIAQEQEKNAKAILDIEEKERKRFAADLHDGLGPMLSAVKINLLNISEAISDKDYETQKSFQKAIRILDESSKEVRNVSHNIMPSVLIKSGLEKAVINFMSQVSTPDIHTDIHISGLKDISLPYNVEIAVYRIIQECVNNIIKYAKAKNIFLSIIHDAEGLHVTIEDDGVGFDKNEINHKGIGIKNVYSRIRYMKGAIDIDSREGNGTLIAFSIPPIV